VFALGLTTNENDSIPNMIGKAIEKECHGIYPLKDCAVRKVKILKRPRFDAAKLLELHAASAEPAGKKVEREAEPEAEKKEE